MHTPIFGTKRIYRGLQAIFKKTPFSNTYNRSPLAEEAFISCTPIPFTWILQIITWIKGAQGKPFNSIQPFMNRYPESDSYERASSMIDDPSEKIWGKGLLKNPRCITGWLTDYFPESFTGAWVSLIFQNFAKFIFSWQQVQRGNLPLKLVEVSAAYAERSVFDKKPRKTEGSIHLILPQNFAQK